MGGSQYICPICGKGYSISSNLVRHQKEHGDNRMRCPHCTYETIRTDNMKRHVQIYHQAPIPNTKVRKRPYPSDSAAPKTTTNDGDIPGPSGLMPPTPPLTGGGHSFVRRQSKEQQQMQQTNGESGQASAISGRSATRMNDVVQSPSSLLRNVVTPPPSTPIDAPDAAGRENNPSAGQGLEQEADSNEAPPDTTQQNLQSDVQGLEVEDESGEVDEALDRILTENRRWIQTYSRITNRIQDRYNFELIGTNLQQIEGNLRHIRSQQTSPFKLNAAFGYVLTDSTNNAHRFYYASKNNRILSHPIIIRTGEDISRFMSEFESLDLLEYCRQQRPNTKFIVRLVTNVLYYVDKLKDFNVGSDTELPNFIKHRKCIISLNKNRRGGFYGDNGCLFRCYQYHMHPDPYPDQEATSELINSYCTALNVSAAKFSGVMLSNLHLFEDQFEINVHVYQLSEDRDSETGKVTVRSRKRWSSREKYDDTMNVNLHNNHFSYITQLSVYCDVWECAKCRKLFRHRGDLNRHVRTCNVTTKIIFPGGGYGIQKTVFERMGDLGIKVPEGDRHFPHRMSFDFEAMSVPIIDDREKKEQLLALQEPVSVSLCSNVPGYTEPKCYISEGDATMLVGQMYTYIQEVSMASYDILCEQFQGVLNEIEYYVNERRYLLDRADQHKQEGDKTEAEQCINDAYVLKPYVRLSNDFDRWLSRIPVLGFNSGRYDFNLIRSYLFPYLLDNDIEVENITKKNNDYLQVLTAHAIFLDIKNFTAAGTSYAGWLKANGIIEGKQFFPYSWLTSLDKLDQNHLPPIEDFYSELRQQGIRQEDYDYLKETWTRLGFRTMRDLLIWYNNADVVPFLEAAQKMVDLWRGIGIDCYKNGMISLPGLALAYLTKAMQAHTILPLFDNSTADVYQTLRDNIVGGLSIVMHRYHEQGETLLPNGKLCEYICSLDANSLYLWALGQPTGTGLFALWRPSGGGQSAASVDWISPPDRNPITDARKVQKWKETVQRNLSIEFHRKQAYPYSRSEVNWLEWMAYSTGQKIEHRFNGRQKIVYVTPDIQYRLDGYHPDSQTAYSFHGCLWHGHGCHLDTGKDAGLRDKRRQKTIKVTQTLKDKGFTMVEMWECEWHKEMVGNPQIYAFLEEHLNLKMRKTKLTGAEILEAVQNDQIFGLLECDLEVPWFDAALIDYFAEFPPICKNIELQRSQIGDHMRVYAEERGYMKRPVKCMVSSYWARKILLSTPLVKWYLEHGLWVTRIYQMIEMKPKACFSDIRDEITEHRRKADANPDYAPLGNAWKTVGNSLYGKTMTRKDKFKKTKLVRDEKVSRVINDAKFVKMEEVGETAYEVCQDLSKIKMDLPLSVATFVYNYAKMQMLDFVYGFLKKYLHEGSYQLVASDTDSIIAAYSSKNIDDLVVDELKGEYFKHGKKKYLVTDEHSKREPGKMKVEAEATGIIALCSKTYIMWSDADKKVSSKGLSRRTNDFGPSDFWNVLTTKIKGSGTNFGFRVKDDKLVQYRQDREGLAYLYGKREVERNGVTTKPLYI